MTARRAPVGRAHAGAHGRGTERGVAERVGPLVRRAVAVLVDAIADVRRFRMPGGVEIRAVAAAAGPIAGQIAALELAPAYRLLLEASTLKKAAIVDDL